MIFNGSYQWIHDRNWTLSRGDTYLPSAVFWFLRMQFVGRESIQRIDIQTVAFPASNSDIKIVFLLECNSIYPRKTINCWRVIMLNYVQRPFFNRSNVFAELQTINYLWTPCPRIRENFVIGISHWIGFRVGVAILWNRSCHHLQTLYGSKILSSTWKSSPIKSMVRNLMLHF